MSGLAALRIVCGMHCNERGGHGHHIGVRDVVAAFGQTVAHRRIDFEHTTNATRYLLMANGANHSAWSGTRQREPVVQ